MFHYLATFKTAIQAYNSAPFFGQIVNLNTCDVGKVINLRHYRYCVSAIVLSVHVCKIYAI